MSMIKERKGKERKGGGFWGGILILFSRGSHTQAARRLATSSCIFNGEKRAFYSQGKLTITQYITV